MRQKAPLSGADAYLLAVERMMAAAGQGQHLGLTVLELGAGFESAKFRSAVERVAAVSPIAAAGFAHSPGGLPTWHWKGRTAARFPIVKHPPGTCVQAICQARLNETRSEAIAFDIIPSTTVIMSWRHLLLDAKGAELLLAEIARLSEDENAEPLRAAWGPARERPVRWREFAEEASRFKDHFNAHARLALESLGGAQPRAGMARFVLAHFNGEETQRIAHHAHECTRGLFMLPWFLAVAVRVHRAVFQARGREPESYQASCAVQERKRGARQPIWQNQVTQLFFRLTPGEAGDLSRAAQLLQEQFESLTRARMEVAFAHMAGLLRRLPSSWYLSFLRKNSGGHLTSFFFSYTGTFLHECQAMAGAPILNGWHVPSVCAPPGTGLFFSERGGCLTATLAWRDGVLDESEVTLMRETMRREMLGA